MVFELIGAMIGIQGAAAALDVSKGFMSPEEKKIFDQENARDGIHIGEIERIARRCKVKPNKWGTLPVEGYNKCLQYVGRYANRPEDIETFIEMWKITVHRQILAEPEKIKQGKDAQGYPDRKEIVLRQAQTMDRNNLLTFEITHWRGLSKAEHIKRMDDIANKTCMKAILAQHPTLRWSFKVSDAYTEFWTIYGQPGERVDSWMTKRNFEGTYSICAAHLGYDAEL